MGLNEGEIVDVTVSSVEDFGLLVKFEDKKGVVLVTNLYWDCDGAQKRMFEEFKPGQQIRVKVLVITSEQFSGSIKHLHLDQDPWKDPSIYSTGTKHRGTVTLIFDFGGALVKFENGVKAFVERPKPTTVLNDSIDVIIKTIDVERQKLEAEQV